MGLLTFTVLDSSGSPVPGARVKVGTVDENGAPVQAWRRDDPGESILAEVETASDAAGAVAVEVVAAADLYPENVRHAVRVLTWDPIIILKGAGDEDLWDIVETAPPAITAPLVAPPVDLPANGVIFGDSYLDPDPPGVDDAADGWALRHFELLGLNYGHRRNEAVSGSAVGNHRTAGSYVAALELWAPEPNADPVGAPAGYPPPVAHWLAKFGTNDGILGTGTAALKAFARPLELVGMRAAAAAVYQHDDAAWSTTGDATALAWADLAGEPYVVTPHDPAEPWGGGAGCLRLDVGATASIDVPADHRGAFDLYLIGGVYGATFTVEVDGEEHGTDYTGGTGVAWYGSSRVDLKAGLVYRIEDLDAGAHTVTITVTDVDDGEVGADGRLIIDSAAVRAAWPPAGVIAYPPTIPEPSGFWVGVTEAVTDVYAAQVDDVVADLNGAWADYTAAVAADTTTALEDSGEDLDGAGHPKAVASAMLAAITAAAFKSTRWEPRQLARNADWVTDAVGDTGPSGPSGSTIYSGDGPPGDVTDPFDGDDGDPLGDDWTVELVTGAVGNAATWEQDGAGNAWRATDTVNPGASIAYVDAVDPDAAVEVVLDDTGLNNHGPILRRSGPGDFLRLGISSSFGNWVLYSHVGGSITALEANGPLDSVEGPHVAGTRVRIKPDGNTLRFYFDGELADTVELPEGHRHSSGTGAGLYAPGHFVGVSTETRWREFAAGPVADAVAGDWWDDTSGLRRFGPYDADLDVWGGPIDFGASFLEAADLPAELADYAQLEAGAGNANSGALLLEDGGGGAGIIVGAAAELDFGDLTTWRAFLGAVGGSGVAALGDGTALDVVLARDAAGVLALFDGIVGGNLATLRATALRLTSSTYPSIEDNAGHVAIRPATARRTFLQNDGGDNVVIIGTDADAYTVIFRDSSNVEIGRVVDDPTNGLLRGIGVPLVAYKAADTVRSNTATETADPDLVLPVDADSAYEVTLWLPCSATASADFSQGWDAPAGASMDWGWSQASGQNALNIGQTKTTGGNGAGVVRMHWVTGTLLTAGTAGNLAVTWAQNDAELSDVTAHAGARLKLIKVG